MADIIQLLPDSVANQIAAGEVIQRPASAVKELLENAVDAQATDIKLIIKDAGKTLIQTIDNGLGMSETDARMCFERHATSKIKKAEDLFSLKSMGFRGEAMASIAAVAQCELKSKTATDELGTHLVIEGSKVISQESCGCPKGTAISIKNLFFNIPARRKFLKSDPVEMRHIADEFQRIALANPEIAMSLYHNDKEQYNLLKGSFRQRIVALLGKNYNQKLVPVEEETNIVIISGFIGKPEAAKRTRGEQYLFVNNRFVRSPYMHNAIQNAFSEVIPNGHHPSYFLKLTVDPNNIDINIHPTKTEIKFTEDKFIYAIIRTAVKQSIGKYNVAPSLDFEQEQIFNIPLNPNQPITAPQIDVNPNFNPFEEEKNKFSSNTKETNYTKPELSERQKSNKDNWQEMYDNSDALSMIPSMETTTQQVITSDWDKQEATEKHTIQIHNKYILNQIKSGIILINQQRAHERILFEKYMTHIEENKGVSQQLLFPETVELTPTDFSLLKEIEQDVRALGFDYSDFGKNCIVIHGTPVDAISEEVKKLLEGLLEQYKMNQTNLKLDTKTNLAQVLAKKSAIKEGKKLKKEEMDALIDQLFACTAPYSTPDGLATVLTLSLDELASKFDA